MVHLEGLVGGTCRQGDGGFPERGRIDSGVGIHRGGGRGGEGKGLRRGGERAVGT